MTKQAFRRSTALPTIPATKADAGRTRAEILAEMEKVIADSETEQHGGTESTSFLLLDISLIYPGRYQPRFGIKPEGIDDLAADINRIGHLINPILVRADDQGKYELIAGERRWRACKQLGWNEIPAKVISVSEEILILSALSENIQRQDLSEMEIGFYLKRMLELGVTKTKSELAERVGIDRRSFYKYLAFTDLPQSLQNILKTNPNAFSAASAEIMRDLCEQGFCGRVHQAAELVVQKKLSSSNISQWVKRSPEYDRSVEKIIILDGIRIGSLSYRKNEMRIRLLKEAEKISDEALADAIAAAIKTRKEPTSPPQSPTT